MIFRGDLEDGRERLMVLVHGGPNLLRDLCILS